MSNGGLNQLLSASNRVAKAFGQPELYVSGSSRKGNTKAKPSVVEDAARNTGDFSGYFHISIAWALGIPSPAKDRDSRPTSGASEKTWGQDVEDAMRRVCDINITFNEVKVKIGQDITSVPFPIATKSRGTNLFGT